MNTTTRTTIETLETRAMMSVTAYMENGIAYLKGDAGNNKIHVEASKHTLAVYDISAKSYGKGAPILTSLVITSATGVMIYGQDGNDVIELGATPAKPCSVLGGLGDDVLLGSNHTDALYGGAGQDFLMGKGGTDYLFGENGGDSLIGDGPGSPVGHDFLSGGKGTDMVTYYYAPSAVKATLGVPTSNGVAGESDNIQGDVENLAGSSFADNLTGNALSNSIWGRGGNDTINGMAGQDALYGDAGNDTITGGQGSDVLVGNAGSDTFYASDDADLDVVWGGNYGVASDANNEYDTAYRGQNANGLWDAIGGEIEKIWNVA